MRFVHLSDIHYHPTQKNFTNYVLTPLINDLKIWSENRKIDLILFTGDLIDRGGYSEKKVISPLEAFEAFEENFINPLLSSLNLSKEKFVFIPGNHDINRSSINRMTEIGLKESLNSEDVIDDILKDTENLNLERIEDYKLFENVYYSEYPKYIPNDLGYTMVQNVNGNTLGIAGINSSWRCYDENDKGNLIVGKKQLEYIDNEFQDENLDTKIALMHHSFEFLHPAESDYIHDTIIRDYDMLLLGHTHSGSAYSVTTSLGKGCILSTSPSNWQNNNYQGHTLYRNGFNIIDYNKEEGSINIHFRRYNYEKNQFVGNTDLGEGDSATSTFSIGTQEDKKIWIGYSETISYIKDGFKDEINKNLVSYNTDTKAPKDLKELFVIPKIVKAKYETPVDEEIYEKERKEVLNLDELCKTEKHLLLFGPSETGKTTILYRIATELIDNSTSFKRIPIYIDLKTLTNKDLLRQIANFIGQTKSGMIEILQLQSIVLLLDNMRYIITQLSHTEIGR